MKILVTGASGEFGRMASEQLLQKVNPKDLILISRSPDKLADFAKRGAEVRRGDFDNLAELETAFAGADKMLFISTLDIGKNRRRQHLNAVEAAKAAGIKHIVYTSSAGMHPNSPTLSLQDHYYTEDVLRDCKINFTILRNSQYAEVIVNMIAPAAVSMGKLSSASGDGHIAFVSKHDCVDVAVTVLLSQGNDHINAIYEVTGPELLTYGHVAKLAAEFSGRPVEFKLVSDEEKLLEFDALGFPREYVEGMVGWASTEMISYEQAIRRHFYSICSHHVKLVTGRQAISLREVFERNKAQFK
jgi:NAD(P)H dehydrogenase (quinone)